MTCLVVDRQGTKPSRCRSPSRRSTNSLPSSSMSTSSNSSPCGGCGDMVGGVHTCHSCSVHMHPFCGKPIGKEGFGQPVICPRCEAKEVSPAIPSASPIVAAFQRAGMKETSTKGLQEDDVDVVSSEDESDYTSIADQNKDKENNAVRKPLIRSRPAVPRIRQRQKVVQWLIARVSKQDNTGKKGLFAAAVDAFPEIFSSRTRNSNIAKAMDWFKKKEVLLAAKRGAKTLSSKNQQGRKRVDSKVFPGRGRRRSAWVTWFYGHLVSEFDRLRKAGLKFDAPLLRQVALRILKPQGDGYDELSVDEHGSLLKDKITPRWKQVSSAKQREIEEQVARHLGELQCAFEDGTLNEDTVENIDETHFVIDFESGKTLGFVGETSVKFADAVSGGQGTTMVVRIYGGPSARIHPPMMILTNQDPSYPICGVKDNIPGVCYRTGPKGWMDKRIFREYLAEKRAMNPDRHGRTKTIYLDNCSSHLSEDECMEELKTLNARLRFLPPNATDLCQSAGSFVIAKIKDVWSRKWNERKIDLIEGDQWQDAIRKDGSWSGKLKNPGKAFFLSLALEAAREVNATA